MDADVIVVGATPGGIACALRCARDGHDVALVDAARFVGGMWASGVQVFDTRYAGHRCPLLTEFGRRLADHYRRTDGDGSDAHRLACFGNPAKHGERPRFEPKVAEAVWTEMLREAPRVKVRLGLRIERVDTEGAKIRAIVFRSEAGEAVRLTADLFVDATYEGDLAAGAGAPYTVGREGRDTHGEPHAGRIFTTIEPIGEIGSRLARSLGLHYFNRTSRRLFPGSDGGGDGAVQAYATRLVLTDVAANRRSIDRPAGYDRSRYLGIVDRSPEAVDRPYPLSSHYLCGDPHEFEITANLPHGKTDWIGANYVGHSHGYPDADPAQRKRLQADHAAHALGMLYFLQNDPAVPAVVRERLGPWGLAKDEYVANGNLPHTTYVREARRLRGLYVFTEHDARRHARHRRTPIHADSVAFGEWPMDSHDCQPRRQPGSFNDGEFILAEETLPSHIPYRCLLSPAVDNLLVPVAMSSSHVGWGTLRLEPVFVHVGEAAAVAADLCLRENRLPRQLAPGRLQRELLRKGIVVSYFADLDLGGTETWVRDAQWLGARGFFAGYDADRQSELSAPEQRRWEGAFSRWIGGEAPDPNACADSAHPPAATEKGLRCLRRAGWAPRPGWRVDEAVQAVASALRSVDEASGCEGSPATAAFT